MRYIKTTSHASQYSDSTCVGREEGRSKPTSYGIGGILAECSSEKVSVDENQAYTGEGREIIRSDFTLWTLSVTY